MSYQVLARKWRPKSFNEVIGQEHVLTVLSNALSLGRVHHAYLFSGTRGVGKTSIARLLAKGLNCESGITAKPCGVCDNCRDIEQARFIDLLEIDAASRTKVEDTREILDNIQYLPTKGRFKVYLIDEVHMLSRSSFNALLKTLEEPPEHVKFLLATTDPQKLPVTILSRCLHLHLNVLDDELIKQQLVKILQTEQISQEDKAVQLLAKAANGSMRDALSLTDQAIALGNGKVESQSVSVMLGTLDKAIPFALVESLYHSDGNALMQNIASAAKQGVDWDSLLTETASLLHQISFLQVVPSAIGDYSNFAERIRYLAQHISPNDVQLFYQILLIGRKELMYAPDKKAGVEMSFLRALAFIPKTFTPTSHDPDLKKDMVVEHQLVNTELSHSLVPVTSNVLAPQERDTPANQSIVKKSMPLPKTERREQAFNRVADVTKNILAARQQIIDHTVEKEKTLKKPKQVEKSQPAYSKNTLAQYTVNKVVDMPDTDDNLKEMGDDMAASAKTAATYQWQFSEHFTPNSDTVLGAKSILSAFEHEKTPELTQKLVQEAIKIDPWSAEIESLSLPPLIKQIMVNAFVEKIDDNNRILHLRSPLSHLTKNQTNIKRLSDILSAKYERHIEVKIIIDDEQSSLTPLEVREKIYQAKLAEAKQLIYQDNKVDMICQFFEAKIDDKSIHPV